MITLSSRVGNYSLFKNDTNLLVLSNEVRISDLCRYERAQSIVDQCTLPTPATEDFTPTGWSVDGIGIYQYRGIVVLLPQDTSVYETAEILKIYDAELEDDTPPIKAHIVETVNWVEVTDVIKGDYGTYDLITDGYLRLRVDASCMVRTMEHDKHGTVHTHDLTIIEYMTGTRTAVFIDARQLTPVTNWVEITAVRPYTRDNTYLIETSEHGSTQVHGDCPVRLMSRINWDFSSELTIRAACMRLIPTDCKLMIELSRLKG